MSRFDLNALIKNNYFYGKLLTVRDFKTEQEYVEMRQRMMNRLMMGYGVVTGLRSVMIDDQTLSVEPGIAIDTLGREIVVPFPVTEKLSLLEGFEELTDVKELYLCLSYNEEGYERVQSISNVQETLDDLSQYNRTKESFKLSLKASGPDLASGLSSGVLYNQKILFEKEDVTVTLVYPKVIGVTTPVSAQIVVSKKSNETHVDYEIKMGVLDAADKTIIEETVLSCIKIEKETSMQSVESYDLECSLMEHARIVLSIGDQGRVIVDGERFELKATEVDIEVLTTGMEDWIKDAYFRQSLHSIVGDYTDDCIYLAKIQLIKVDHTFMMKDLTFNPFDQYILGPEALKQLLDAKTDEGFNGFEVATQSEVLEVGSEPTISADFDKGTGILNMKFGMPDPLVMVDRIRTGIVEFPLDENFRFGKNLVSDELTHGLGLGPVYIQLGLVNHREGFEGDDESEKIYYGSSEVFFKGDHEGEVGDYTFGSVVYPIKGTFRVGLRINKGTKGDVIRLRWWAYKEQAGYTSPESIKVKILPGEIELTPNETIQFSAFVQGDKTHQVTWSMEDETAGKIDDYGLFEAGEVDGSYKIIATSVKDTNCFSESYVRIKGVGKLGKLKKVKI